VCCTLPTWATDELCCVEQARYVVFVVIIIVVIDQRASSSITTHCWHSRRFECRLITKSKSRAKPSVFWCVAATLFGRCIYRRVTNDCGVGVGRHHPLGSCARSGNGLALPRRPRSEKVCRLSHAHSLLLLTSLCFD
jgi:hypothetical protein